MRVESLVVLVLTVCTMQQVLDADLQRMNEHWLISAPLSVQIALAQELGAEVFYFSL